jgi:SAM-dependent methyltransferase
MMKAMNPHPFDAAARDYDRTFTHRQPGGWFRTAVWNLVTRELGDGERVLDLGCGTGEDAVFLARQGKAVCAVDISPSMIDAARAKAEESGLDGQITFYEEDLEDLRLDGQEPFDGLISDFGPLNCVSDLHATAALLSRWVRPGGVAILVVMGPWCPWEILWYGLHGRPGQALRRLRRGLLVPVGEGAERVPVWYHRPGSLRRAFRPTFDHMRLMGLGCLLPPPYLGGLVDRLPRLFACLAAIEGRVGSLFPFNRLCDHYAVVLRRK